MLEPSTAQNFSSSVACGSDSGARSRRGWRNRRVSVETGPVRNGSKVRVGAPAQRAWPELVRGDKAGIRGGNTKGYSSTYLAMVFANVRAGTQKSSGVFGYPSEH